MTIPALRGAFPASSEASGAAAKEHARLPDTMARVDANAF